MYDVIQGGFINVLTTSGVKQVFDVGLCRSDDVIPTGNAFTGLDFLFYPAVSRTGSTANLTSQYGTGVRIITDLAGTLGNIVAPNLETITINSETNLNRLGLPLYPYVGSSVADIQSKYIDSGHNIAYIGTVGSGNSYFPKQYFVDKKFPNLSIGATLRSPFLAGYGYDIYGNLMSLEPTGYKIGPLWTNQLFTSKPSHEEQQTVIGNNDLIYSRGDIIYEPRHIGIVYKNVDTPNSGHNTDCNLYSYYTVFNDTRSDRGMIGQYKLFYLPSFTPNPPVGCNISITSTIVNTGEVQILTTLAFSSDTIDGVIVNNVVCTIEVIRNIINNGYFKYTYVNLSPIVFQRLFTVDRLNNLNIETGSWDNLVDCFHLSNADTHYYNTPCTGYFTPPVTNFLVWHVRDLIYSNRWSFV